MSRPAVADGPLDLPINSTEEPTRSSLFHHIDATYPRHTGAVILLLDGAHFPTCEMWHHSGELVSVGPCGREGWTRPTVYRVAKVSIVNPASPVNDDEPGMRTSAVIINTINGVNL